MISYEVGKAKIVMETTKFKIKIERMSTKANVYWNEICAGPGLNYGLNI